MDTFFIYMIIGFCAQLVDGSLGMAYGVISMSLLMSLGISPLTASISIHISEIFTTGVSGLSHAMFKNIDHTLFKRLIIPGMIGSIIGAYFLTRISTHIIKPWIAVYLLIMGVVILYKAVYYKRSVLRYPGHNIMIPLGLSGGFFDSVGGGGWGPMVSSSLVALGIHPRYAIGSANLSEFLVVVCSSITFVILVGVSSWTIIFGLLLGGIIAAPFTGFIVRIMPHKPFMLIIGILIILLSIRNLIF